MSLSQAKSEEIVLNSVVSDYPELRYSLSLTCQLKQYIAVLGANWSSRSMWEQLTVVYPIGKNLFKTSCSNK